MHYSPREHLENKPVGTSHQLVTGHHAMVVIDEPGGLGTQAGSRRQKSRYPERRRARRRDKSVDLEK